MIPQAKKGDAEAVAQALTTAGTMHALGDHAGALKWLRRATEAAADADADDRTLELAKAAAELASTSALPSANAPPSRPRAEAVVPPPPASRRAWLVSQPSPSAPVVAPPAPPTPQSPSAPSASPPPSAAATAPRPLAERTTFLHPIPPRPALSSVPGDPWLAEALDEDDPGDVASEKTRVGVPAYGAGTKTGTEPVAIRPRVEEPALQPSQAMRVVVWRAPDGVHVAPRGTHVAAIAVDAILVALDPSADLAAWLSGK